MTTWYNFNTGACRDGKRVLLRLKEIPPHRWDNRHFPRDYLIAKFDYEHSEDAQGPFWDSVARPLYRFHEDHFDAWSPLPDLQDEPVAFVK